MKVLVTYHSESGNTEKVAQAIYDGISRDEEKDLRSIQEVQDVESYDVTVSFDGYVKDSTIEEVLMQQAGQTWGIIDFSLMDEISLVVKVYEDKTKTTFKIGYKVTGLQFSDESRDFDANAFASKPITLTSDNLLVTTTEGNL